jgi:hypothetical protein
VQAEGLIVTSYFGGPEAADIVTGVSSISKGAKDALTILPKIANGTLTGPEALNALKDALLDLGATKFDDLSVFSNLGLGGLITSGLDQTVLTPVISGLSPPMGTAGTTPPGTGGHK